MNVKTNGSLEVKIKIEQEIETVGIELDEIAHAGMLAEPEDFPTHQQKYFQIRERLNGLKTTLQFVNEFGQ